MKKYIWNDLIYIPSAVLVLGIPVLSGIYNLIPREDYYVNVISFLPKPLCLLFALPYAAAYYRKNDKTVHLFSKVLSSLALPMAILSLGSPALTLEYWIFCIGIAGGLFFILNYETTGNQKVVDEFPFWLDPKHQKKIPTTSLNENLQVVGNTGAGKTHHVLMPLIYQTIAQKLGLLVTDVKSNMVKDLVYFAEKCGRLQDFLYLDLGHPDRSMTCNPLYGDNPNEIASRVFTALYYDTSNVEPHYVQIANAFLQDLIFLLKKDIKTITFLDIAAATGETDTFRTIAALCAKYPDTEQAKNFQHWLRKTPNQRQDELSGLIIKLRRFCNREWSPLINTCHPQITMKNVMDREKIFLLGLAAAKFPDDAKPLSILFMMALQSEVGERFMNPPQRSFRVVLDEFYNLAYPGFIDLLNKCRDAKVNLVLAHQSNGDLASVSQDFKEQVMNTANNKVILRVSDPTTAEYFADLFGTEHYRKMGSTSYDATGQERGHSDREAKKYRVHPDDIKELPVGEAFVRVATKEKVFHFRTDLGTAPQPPDGFKWDYLLTYKSVKERKNESSLDTIFEKPPKKDKKGPKDFGFNFGEGSNA